VSLAILINGAQVSTAQMALPGKFAVDSMGAATYSIPIAVPPGTAGMAPSLSLDYNNRSGNGIVGLGWTLSGLPSIGRCPQTMAQDGKWVGVNYDSNDRFCLDGQRLVATTGVYGANLTEYRTEIESYSKITSMGTTGTGPTWFEVKTKTGQTMEFGRTSNSRILAQGKTTARSWALNKVTDTVGNYFSVTYTNDAVNGQAYPARIDYTGNAAAALAPFNSVQFTYTTRTDVTSAYQAGSVVRTTVLLANVKTYAETALVSDYQLSYQQSGSTQRKRLSSVKLCSTATICLPATTFAFTADLPLSFANDVAIWLPTEFTRAAGWDNNSTHPRSLVDVNGDGLPDIVGFGDGNVRVSLNTGSSFPASRVWHSTEFTRDLGWTDNNLYPRSLVDVNGDGLPDIVGFGDENVMVSLNTGPNFAEATVWHSGMFTRDAGWEHNGANPRFLVDVNGDGLPDIVGFDDGDVKVSLNTAPNFGLATVWHSGMFTSDVGWEDSSTHPRSLVDVNGDGLPDIVGFGDVDVMVSLNTGSGFALATVWLLNQFTLGSSWDSDSTHPRFLVDVNGDGLPDIVGFGGSKVMVSLNTGASFAPATVWRQSEFTIDVGWENNSTHPRSLVDVNGDGLPDIVGFGSRDIRVSLNTGSSFAPATVWPPIEYTANLGWDSNSTHPRSLVDVNGDGLPDIVGFGGSKVMVSLKNGGMPPDLLTTVTDGLGAQTFVTYKPMTAASVYTKESGDTLPTIDVIGAMYVVSRVDRSNGVAGTYGSSYAYVGARADQRGRGFLGFRQMKTTDLQTNIVETKTFRQDHPFVSQVASETKVLNSTVLKQTVNTYGSNALGGTPIRYQVLLNQNQASGRDLDGSVLPTTTSTFQHDSFGNATWIYVETSHSGIWKKTTTNNYTNDTTRWLLGRLTRSAVKSEIP
jgi:hypothetical protein